MGSPRSEDGRYDDEMQHHVTISRPFWLQATEVTQGQWQALMGTNPSYFDGCGRDCPVEEVNWEDAVAYLNSLSDQEGLARCYDGDRFKGLGCEGYRLPTEAEWEYAARAGTTGARYGDLDAIAWYDGNAGRRTRPVGHKSPNGWGIHDMLGNVWEWVQDWYGPVDTAATDPTGPSSGGIRVVRGGGWDHGASDLRAPNRFGNSQGFRYFNLGFRVARSVP
jgi:formylglycine-generating enzyme required for sulfatase activity